MTSMLQHRRAGLALAAAVALLGSVGQAQAALHTIVGTHFDLTYDDTTLGLFGTPSLVGDNFSFTPNSFQATANGGGYDFKISAVTGLVLTAKAGWQFVDLKLAESGIKILRGTASFVDSIGTLTAFDTAHAGTTQTSASFTAGLFYGAAGSAPVQTVWQGNTVINSSTAALPGNTNVIVSKTKQIGLVIDNFLEASAGAGTGLAVINKNNSTVGIDVSISPIPEPGTYALLLAGMGVLAFRARRTRPQV